MYQGDSINKDFQASMEELFYKYGVDIYFAGHVHSYARNWPVYNGIVEMTDYNNPRASTYLMIGGAGNDEMRFPKLEEKILNQNIDIITGNDVNDVEGDSTWVSSDTDGPWTAYTDTNNHVGIGKVQIIDDSTLIFEYIRTSDNKVHDTMTLKRDHSIFINTK